ncbi:MAG: cobalt ECF transporter T component CbiQ [Holophaga sp.]|nr:cobalt ECF transporter T component CbiQ [Holophaga sp.]
MDLSCCLTDRQGPLWRIDGRIKTALLLPAVVLASALRPWWLALGLWLAATGLFLLLRQSWRDLLKRLLMPLGIAWVVFLSVMLTQGRHPVWQGSVAGLTIRVYREGLAMGLLLFLRVMAAVTLAALLAFSTPMVEILATLRICKVPDTMLDLADMMFRYIFILNDTARALQRARMSRLGGEAPWGRRIADTGQIAANILVQSLDRSTRIYKAMLSRGCSESSHPPPHFQTPVPRRDRRLGWMGAALLLLLSFTHAWIGLRHDGRNHQPHRSLLHLSGRT